MEYNDDYINQDNYDKQKKPKNKKNTLIIILIIASLVLTNVTTFFVTSNFGLIVGNNIVVPANDKTAIKYINKLIALKDVLKEQYYQDLDDEVLWEYAIKGLFAGTKDPYTSYMDEEEYKEFTDSLEGENFVGIGVSINSDEGGYIRVNRVFEKSPAQSAGMQAGDIIVSVDGKDIYGFTSTEASELIRGDSGTTVKVGVERGGKAVTFNITRAKVSVSYVTGEMIGEIGYIHLYEFTSGIGKQFNSILNQLIKDGAKGIIVDLRDNPGGYVDECITIAERILPKDSIIFSTTNKSKKTTTEVDSTSEKLEIPLVLLVNQYSASASEILSAAVQGNDAGDIVGITTYGKGVIQTFRELTDNTGIKITTDEYLSPTGEKIHGEGVKPDYEINFEDENTVFTLIPREDDVQLNKAIEVINSKIK